MQYTINELRHEAFKNVYRVYEVFQNYFGEALTDLQNLPSDDDIIDSIYDFTDYGNIEDGSSVELTEGKKDRIVTSLRYIKPFILVWWPHVKVTNEHNKSINIQDLYAKIELDYEGNIPTENWGFLLNRATYPMEQWAFEYMHSHVGHIPKESPTTFMSPCLGSGPIKDTIRYLKADISEGFDEIRWMLFCEELARYVTVESLEGVPYRKLEEVHLSSALSEYGQYDNYKTKMLTSLSQFLEVFDMGTLQHFIQYYLKHGHLAIGYQQGKFVCGMPYFDYIIDISNAFIEFFNQQVTDSEVVRRVFYRNILCECTVAGGKFFFVEGRYNGLDVSRYIGRKVCDFKGNAITLHIISHTQEPQKTTILNHHLGMFILNNILKIINYHYTNEYTRQHWQGANPNRTETTLPTPTSQRVYYL